MLRTVIFVFLTQNALQWRTGKWYLLHLQTFPAYYEAMLHAYILWRGLHTCQNCCWFFIDAIIPYINLWSIILPSFYYYYYYYYYYCCSPDV